MSRLALLQLARAPSGLWTTWRGGPCPVDPWTRVIALCRDGSTVKGLAGEWSWQHDFDPSGYEEPDEIVAYRVRAPSRVALCGRSAA